MTLWLLFSLSLGTTSAFVVSPVVPRLTVRHESLAEGLFNQAFGGLRNLMSPAPPPTASAPPTRTSVAAGREAARALDIASVDERAKTGDVSFDDFLKVGRTFKQYGGKVPGMPGALTPKQIDETLAKFAKHEKIVLAMTDEERSDPQLVLDDLENTEQKCPRIQRLARVSAVPERDVALFCAEFEAMRISTKRIASGEDPDKVNNDIGNSNRSARRAAKKAGKKRRR